MTYTYNDVYCPSTHIHTLTHKRRNTERERGEERLHRKASVDGLIDPAVELGNIPPTSISINPGRLEASHTVLCFSSEQRGAGENPYTIDGV